MKDERRPYCDCYNLTKRPCVRSDVDVLSIVRMIELCKILKQLERASKKPIVDHCNYESRKRAEEVLCCIETKCF